MRTPGSAAELEAKRMTAARMLQQGMSQVDVARALGVSAMSVCRWANGLAKGGVESLQAKPHPGRRPRLTAKQQKRLLVMLEQGAQKHGFANDLWTCPRIGQLIEKKFGVSYEESSVWRLLRRWGWSCQKPERRAREQDAKAVEKWRKEDWPRIKKGARKPS
jgi:transposase